MIYVLYNILPKVVVTIIILIIIELLFPNVLCNMLHRVHDVSLQKKEIIIDGDTLIYNKTKEQYEPKKYQKVKEDTK